MIVYLVYNTVTEKAYVGQTQKTLAQRWAHHLYEARHGSAWRFHKAIRKHSSAAFDMRVLAEAHSHEELNRLERLWVWALRSMDFQYGYNATAGGDGPPSEDTRRKLSEALSGEKNPFYGRKHSAIVQEKISAALRGRPRSEEAKRKISSSLSGVKNHFYGVKHSEETKAKMRMAWERRRG